MYEAVGQLQKLTGIPINYEDLQYYFPADLQAASPTASGVVVPKGGSFSVDVPVDPVSGKLSDNLSVASALNAVISAAQAAGAVPGTFRVDSSQAGALFVEPTAYHSSTGSNLAAQSALDRQVTVSLQQVAGIDAFHAILQQVSQKTGFRFDDGMGTLALGVPGSKVSITASSEPAKFVLARLLAHVGAQPSTISYIALFEPSQHYFVVNLRNLPVFQSLAPGQPYSPPPLVPGGGNRLGRSRN